jgi:Leucine-rich repeat (LRR) protein
MDFKISLIIFLFAVKFAVPKRVVICQRRIGGECVFSNITIGRDEIVNFKADKEQEFIRDVRIENSIVVLFPVPIFESFSSVQKLFLKFIGIEEIPRGSFVSIERLELLDLSGNLIDNLENDTFTGAVRLAYIDLSRNRLKFFDASFFKPLVTFFIREVIDISFNEISTIQRSSEIKSSVTQIQLSSNKILNFNGNSLKNLNRVKDLDLSNNLIKVLMEDQFIGVPNVKEINLANNQIKRIEGNAFRGLEKLVKLILNKNKLTALEADQFKGAERIQSLYLNFNRLKTLNAHSFKSIESLQTLEMQNNQLEYLPDALFKNPGTLTELFLDNNKIKRLTPNIFSSLTKLKTLQISSNQLTFIPSNIFANGENLKQVCMNGNHIAAISEKAFSLLLSPAVHFQGNVCADFTGQWNGQSFKNCSKSDYFISKVEKLKSDFGKAALEFKLRLEIVKDAMKYVIRP